MGEEQEGEVLRATGAGARPEVKRGRSSELLGHGMSWALPSGAWEASTRF